MKNGRTMGAAAVIVLALATVLLTVSAPAPGQVYEKICPISFHLYPGTKLESSCAAKVEKDNAKLSAFLSATRTSEVLNPYRQEVKAILADEGLTPAERTARIEGHRRHQQRDCHSFRDGIIPNRPRIRHLRKLAFGHTRHSGL